MFVLLKSGSVRENYEATMPPQNWPWGNVATPLYRSFLGEPENFWVSRPQAIFAFLEPLCDRALVKGFISYWKGKYKSFLQITYILRLFVPIADWNPNWFLVYKPKTELRRRYYEDYHKPLQMLKVSLQAFRRKNYLHLLKIHLFPSFLVFLFWLRRYIWID